MTFYKIGEKVPMPERKKSQTIRDVIPNGEDFRSKGYAAVKQGVVWASGKMPNEYWNRIGMEHPCPVCEKPIGEMCVSIAVRKTKMNRVHQQRIPKGLKKNL